MIKELIGAAITIGAIGILYLAHVLIVAIAECARDSAEFPEQNEAEEAKQ